MKEIAVVVFETFETVGEANLTQILSRVESIEVSNLITELADTGQAKGNYQLRIDKAVEILQRSQKQKSQTEAIKDAGEVFREVCNNTTKSNPHSLGMR